MNLQFPYILFFDLQAALPMAFCPDCGSECYGPGRCLYCGGLLP